MKFTLDCKQMSRLLSDQQDGELPAADTARMRLHLVLCEACRTVDEQMQFLRRAMKKLGEGDPPPE